MPSALISHLPLMQQGKATGHEAVQRGPEHPVSSLLTAARYRARAVTLMPCRRLPACAASCRPLIAGSLTTGVHAHAHAHARTGTSPSPSHANAKGTRTRRGTSDPKSARRRTSLSCSGAMHHPQESGGRSNRPTPRRPAVGGSVRRQPQSKKGASASGRVRCRSGLGTPSWRFRGRASRRVRRRRACRSRAPPGDAPRSRRALRDRALRDRRPWSRGAA